MRLYSLPSQIELFPQYRTILSLFDYSGNWSKPYRDAGYNVIQVDIKHGQDVRLIEHPGKVHGILAAPPCTHFAVSGARWWADKTEDDLLDSLSMVDAVMRLVMITNPVWWVIENPVGRLTRYIGDPVMYFDPCHYGDSYTKKTGLWGSFNSDLPKTPVEPTEGSKMHLLPPGPKRAELRSMTPLGFAQAFFQANP